MKRLNLSLCLMVLCVPAWAANFCVTSASELQAAFDVAENNGESDIIRIAQGTYTAPAGGFLFAPNITGGVDESSDIEIIGGWTAFFDNPCGVGPSTDPAETVLSGGGVNRIMDLRLPQQGSVSIRNLTFINGFPPDLSQGAGLRIYAASTLGFSGTLTVQSNAFIANSGGYASGLMIGRLNTGNNMQGTVFTNIRILNNLFVGNTARTGAAGAAMVRLSTPLPQSGPVLDPRPALTLANNTILNNTSTAPILRGVFETADAVTLNTAGANLSIVNNNIRGNGDRDAEVFSESDQSFVARNNNLGTVFYAVVPDVLTANIGVDPEYVDCGVFCIDRIPVGDSPLIDAGIAPAPFGSAWSLPDTDAAGGIRVRGAAVDIGAYEGTPDRIFSDRFEN
jgi:hypothetical protein